MTEYEGGSSSDWGADSGSSSDSSSSSSDSSSGHGGIDYVLGRGQRLGQQTVKAGDNRLVIAGGFENMTAAPHFARVREGVKFGPAPATLKVGDTIDWKNGDMFRHTATAAGQRHLYDFQATKGLQVRFTAVSRSLGSPAIVANGETHG